MNVKMPNTSGHGPWVIELFSCSSRLSMKIVKFINKIQIDGAIFSLRTKKILEGKGLKFQQLLITRTNIMLMRVDNEKSFMI